MKIFMSFNVTTYELEPQALAKILQKRLPKSLVLPFAKQTGLPSHVEVMIFEDTDDACAVQSALAEFAVSEFGSQTPSRTFGAN